MDLIIYLVQAVIGLAVILLVLTLFGITPYEVGGAVGDAFGSLGRFFEGARDS